MKSSVTRASGAVLGTVLAISACTAGRKPDEPCNVRNAGREITVGSTTWECERHSTRTRKYVHTTYRWEAER